MLYLPSLNYSCYYSNCSEDGGCSGYWYWGSSDGSTSSLETGGDAAQRGVDGEVV